MNQAEVQDHLPERVEESVESELRYLNCVPAPWDYNPASWRQRTAVAGLAAIAGCIALYLGLYQLRVIATVWDPIFGEQTIEVIDSEISHGLSRWIGIPDAILGSLAYFSDVVFALAGSARRWQFRPWLVMLFGLDVIPLGITSAILVGVQSFALGAWCFLCLITAAVSIMLVVFAYDEVWSCVLYLRLVYRRTRSMREVWWVFLGYPSAAAVAAGEALTRRDNVAAHR